MLSDYSNNFLFFSLSNSYLILVVGSIFELLHNSYVKGGLALGALLGPGRGKLLLVNLFSLGIYGCSGILLAASVSLYMFLGFLIVCKSSVDMND